MLLDLGHERRLGLDLADLLADVEAAIMTAREKISDDRMMRRHRIERDLVIRSKRGSQRLNRDLVAAVRIPQEHSYTPSP